jgi:hypothetical protein
MKPHYLLLIVFVCLSACIGCKPKGLDVHAVEGVVMLDGVPYGYVSVLLYPTEPTGDMGFALTDEQGHYRISAIGGAIQQGTTLGTYRVAFNKIVPDGRVPTAEEQADPNFNPARFPGLERTRDLVPRKYQLPDTSGFEITVEKGKNVHNFDLFSK